MTARFWESPLHVLGPLLLLTIACQQLHADTLILATDCGGTTVSSGAADLPCSFMKLPGATDYEEAQGNLSFGTFGAVANSVRDGNSVSATSSVSVLYNFSIPSVQSGTVLFDLSASGTVTGTGYFELNFSTPEQASINGVPAATTSYLQNGLSSIEISTPIVQGVAQLVFFLQAQAVAICSSSCGSESNFLDPVSISSASVFDANGNLVSDATLVSQSGFNPNQVPTPATPEPTSIVLVSSVIGFMALLRGRMRGTAAQDG